MHVVKKELMYVLKPFRGEGGKGLQPAQYVFFLKKVLSAHYVPTTCVRTMPAHRLYAVCTNVDGLCQPIKCHVLLDIMHPMCRLSFCQKTSPVYSRLSEESWTAGLSRIHKAGMSAGGGLATSAGSPAVYSCMGWSCKSPTRPYLVRLLHYPLWVWETWLQRSKLAKCLLWRFCSWT